MRSAQGCVTILVSFFLLATATIGIWLSIVVADMMSQLMKRVDGTWHRLHAREDGGHVVPTSEVLACSFRKAVDAGLEINEHAVHVDEDRELFHWSPRAQYLPEDPEPVDG